MANVRGTNFYISTGVEGYMCVEHSRKGIKIAAIDSSSRLPKVMVGGGGRNFLNSEEGSGEREIGRP